jgi:WD40 repeat protein/Leucine-rich repeat (LRR) protein
MAPEQARGAAIDGRSDLFSLGVVLYRLCTGRLPFWGDSTMAVLTALATEAPRPVRDLNPAVPPALGELVMQLLTKDPARRPGSATEVARRLADIETGLTVPLAKPVLRAEPPNPWVDLDVTQSVSPTRQRGVPSDPRSRVGLTGGPPRRRWIVASVVVLALLPLGYFYGGTVIRIATNKGQLVVEVDDPKVEVTVKENGAVIQDRPGEREITLVAGEHEVQVTIKDAAGETHFFTRKLTLKRGGREVVDVRQEVAAKGGEPKGKPTVLAAPRQQPQPARQFAPLAKLPIPQLPAESPLDKLDPRMIPPDEREDWQPKELVAVIGTQKQRMWSSVQHVAPSLDGKAAIVASYHEGAFVVHLTTLLRRALPSFPPGAIWSHPTKRIGVDVDRRVFDFSGAQWHLLGQIPLPEGETRSGISRAGGSADGRYLVCQWYGTHTIVNLSDPRNPRQLLAFPGTAAPAAFAPDSKTLAVYLPEEKRVHIYELTGRHPKDMRSFPAAVTIAWLGWQSNDGIITVGGETPQFWNLRDKDPRPTPSQPWRADPVLNSVVFSPDRSRLAVGYQYRATVWDVTGAKPIALNGHVTAVYDGDDGGYLQCLAFTPDAKTLISGYLNGAIRLWDVSGREAREKTPYPDYERVATLPIFSPDGSTIATNHTNGHLRLWRLDGPAPRRIATPADANWEIAGFSDDTSVVAARSGPVVNRRWRIKGGTAEPVRNTVFPPGYVMAISPDRRTWVVAQEAGWLLWDMSADEPRLRGARPLGVNLSRIRFTADSKTMFAGPFDGGPHPQSPSQARCWDISAEQPRERPPLVIEGLRCTALHPDGTRIAASTEDGKTTIWNLNTGKSEPGTFSAGQCFSFMDFSPDGKQLLGCHDDFTVQLWDLDSGLEVKRWTFPGPVQARFAPDGRHIITKNANGTAYVLRLRPATAVQTDESPDRKAAKWVLSVGGTLKVGGDGQEVAIRGSRDLPAARFAVVSIDLDSNSKVDDAGLARMKGLAHLKGLSLQNNWKVSDAGLAHLTGLTNLASLNMHGTSVSNPGLTHLKGLTSLAELDLAQTQVTDAGLAHLEGLTKLTGLTLSGTRVSDVGLVHLNTLNRLTSLGLSSSSVTDDGLAQLKPLTNLTSLSLTGTRVGDGGLVHLKDLPKLAFLDLGGTRVSDDGLVHLKGLTNLTDLRIHSTRVGDAGLVHLKGLPRLSLLYLGGTRVTDAGLRNLISLPLANIDLDNSRVSARGLASLHSAFPSAQITGQPRPSLAEDLLAAGATLVIRSGAGKDDRAVTKRADLPREPFLVRSVKFVGVDTRRAELLARLGNWREYEFERLEGLTLPEAAVEDLGFARSLQSLQELTISDAKIADLQPLSGLKRLRTLMLRRTAVTSLASLAGLTNLEELSLHGTPIVDAALQALDGLPNLRKVDLQMTSVTGRGLGHLAKLPKLAELSVAGSKVSDLFAEEVGALTKLEKLSLARCTFSDEGLKHLAGLTHLKKLDLTGTQVTAEGVAGVQKALPKCRIMTRQE